MIKTWFDLEQNTLKISRKFVETTDVGPFYTSCGWRVPDGYREENDDEFRARLKAILKGSL
jgi:hypothetical protein